MTEGALAHDHAELETRTSGLPIAVISRIMKRHLPPNVKISDESKQLISDCAVEFIRFVTSEAIDMSVDNRRRILSGDDMIGAMKTLGFDAYVNILEWYLAKYREVTSSSMTNTKYKLSKKTNGIDDFEESGFDTQKRRYEEL